MECKAIQRNTILIAQSISKLVEKIKSSESRETDLKLLEEKCFSNEEEVSLAAAEGIILLVKNKIVPFSSVLFDIVSAIPVAKSHIGVTTILCDLLELDAHFKVNSREKCKSSYNLCSSQHPLISILSCHQNSFPDILTKIKRFYKSGCDRTYLNESLYSFYMYVICNPTYDVLDLYQYKLWSFLIEISESVNIVQFIAWLQISSKHNCLKTSVFLIELLNSKNNNDDIQEIVILWLTSLVYELLNYNCDPREVIVCLCDAIEGGAKIEKSTSTILTILSRCVSICSSVYVHDLLVLCKKIVFLSLSNKFSLHCLKASLLQWLAYGCILTENSEQIRREILVYIENNKESAKLQTNELYSNKMLHFLKSTNRTVDLAIEVNVLSEFMTESNGLELLHEVSKLPPNLLNEKMYFFTALLLYDTLKPETTLKIIEVLLKVGDAYKEHLLELLTLFLYKLSHSTNSEIIFALLKTLPKMAAIKENVGLVISTLELFRKGMFDLSLFVVTLFYDLWEIDPKYFMYLSNVLNNLGENTFTEAQWWEANVTKAHILKKISIKKPEVHGRELVGHLSEILNKCNRKDGVVALALAIDSIGLLYNAGIIDISSTWNEIGPRFHSETNVVVIKSLCKLMSEVSYCDPNEYSEKLLEEIFIKLWNYAAPTNDVEIIAAAYKALGCFKIEQISSYLPDKYKFVNDELILGATHGKSWLKLLQDYQEESSDVVGNFLIKLVSNEISQYRSGTYKVEEGRKEPPDFVYLPNHSVVKALGNYLQLKVQQWQNSDNKNVYLQCLRILSKEYVKPLPPVDWCFLQELVHFDETRPESVTLASHQLQLSGTARRFIENYIIALTNLPSNNKTIIIIVRNLKYLCNSIQPVILQPFLKNSIQYALKNDHVLLKTIIENFKVSFSMKNLHEANKLVLSEEIVDMTTTIKIQTELFIKLLEVIVLLPSRFLDQLILPAKWKEGTEDKVQKAIQIRCELALNTSCLNSLNVFLDSDHYKFRTNDYILQNVSKVMSVCGNSDFTVTWIIELLGQIQSTIANENTVKSHLHFLCNLFIVSTITLAGHNWLYSKSELITNPESCLRIFPQSIITLIKLDSWKRYIVQLSEWFFHMFNFEQISEKYQNCFYLTLAALRHEDAIVNGKWMKYMGLYSKSITNL